MPKKNIFFFLPNFSEGGAGKSILRICKNLNKSKFNIYIISLKKNFYKNELNKYCKKIFEINETKASRSFKFIKNNILCNFDKEKNIFISNINYLNVLSLIFLKLQKFPCKLVLTERTPYQELNYYYGFKDYIKKSIIKILIYFLYKYSDLIIANSKKSKQNHCN